MDPETIIHDAIARADMKALESRWARQVEAMPYYTTEAGFATALRAVLLDALLPPPPPGGPA
jgi:hypothetical protein